MTEFKYVLVMVLGYALGCINFAVLIARFKRTNIRDMGSGNPGTMNVARNFGLTLGALTLLLDALKGALAAAIGWWLIGGFGSERIGIYLGGFCAVLGHIFPAIYRFKGGKGIATTIGFMFVVNPVVALFIFVGALSFFALVRIGSLTSFICIYLMIALEGISIGASNQKNSVYYAILLFATFLLTLIAHTKNITRLFTGTEKSIKLRK